MTSPSALTIDELADGICLRAGRIAAAEAELLRWIAEFDRRVGWAGPGMLSCAHWLSWRTGLSPGTARERVRVARRLEELPEVAAAFADGRVSYSKVRAITRVAADDDGVNWVRLARSASASQLERIVRGVERAKACAAAEADPEAAGWPLRTTLRYDEHGNFTLTVRGPAQYAPVVRAGLDARKAELRREREAAETNEGAAVENPPPLVDVPAGTSMPAEAAAPEPAEDDPGLDEQAPGWPEGTTRRQVREAAEGFVTAQQELRRAEGQDLLADAGADGQVASAPVQRADISVQAPQPSDVPAGTSGSLPVTDADALLALAQDALAAEKAAHPDVARSRRPQLTAQIDPRSGWARQADGELLPPSSLRAVMKTLPGRAGVVRLRPVTDADLRRFDLGRSQREANAALRELLGTLDGERCRFPGCTRHRKLHAHHVVFWSHDGPTDLANLVLVCARHHTLIHTQGFQLVLHPDRRLSVSTADGVPVLHHPAQPWGDPAALSSGCGQRVSAETLPPEHCDARIELGYVVSVLLAQSA